MEYTLTDFCFYLALFTARIWSETGKTVSKFWECSPFYGDVRPVEVSVLHLWASAYRVIVVGPQSPLSTMTAFSKVHTKIVPIVFPEPQPYIPLFIFKRLGPTRTVIRSHLIRKYQNERPNPGIAPPLAAGSIFVPHADFVKVVAIHAESPVMFGWFVVDTNSTTYSRGLCISVWRHVKTGNLHSRWVALRPGHVVPDGFRLDLFLTPIGRIPCIVSSTNIATAMSLYGITPFGHGVLLCDMHCPKPVFIPL